MIKITCQIHLFENNCKIFFYVHVYIYTCIDLETEKCNTPLPHFIIYCSSVTWTATTFHKTCVFLLSFICTQDKSFELLISYCKCTEQYNCSAQYLHVYTPSRSRRQLQLNICHELIPLLATWWVMITFLNLAC